MKRLNQSLGSLLIAGLCAFAGTSPAAAQVGSPGTQVTRQALETYLAEVEAAAASPAYSERLRAEARQEAAKIRARLEQGDFRTGDRVIMTVEGQPELSDTFLVTPERTLRLPGIQEVSLHGVLRSELETHITAHLTRFLVGPRVSAESLVRIAITGAVERPGFYTVPVNAGISDVLLFAGGLSRDAKLRKIRIERGDQRVWDGERMQEAIFDGRTLDELSIAAGDRIFVPRPSRWGTLEVVRFAFTVLPTVLILMTRF